MSGPANAAEAHNRATREILLRMGELVGTDPIALNILIESLLLGVGMLNYPGEPRKQAIIIQAIADAAIDRTIVPPAGERA